MPFFDLKKGIAVVVEIDSLKLPLSETPGRQSNESSKPSE
jgi:hypothetical protein